LGFVSGLTTTVTVRQSSDDYKAPNMLTAMSLASGDRAM
jgi:hypothetical protein